MLLRYPLFLPMRYVQKKNQKETAYQPQNKDNHHKTPNRPPHGTRRSMGKR